MNETLDISPIFLLFLIAIPYIIILLRLMSVPNPSRLLQFLVISVPFIIIFIGSQVFLDESNNIFSQISSENDRFMLVGELIGNGIMTMTGVTLGIPIALGINRIASLQQESKMREIRNAEVKKKGIRVLFLLREEILHNLKMLNENNQIIESHASRRVYVNGYKDELWRTLSTGGELEYIKDLDLLNLLSSSYHYIGRLKFFEDQYFQIYGQPLNGEHSFKEQSLDRISTSLLGLDYMAKFYLSATSNEIDKLRNPKYERNDPESG